MLIDTHCHLDKQYLKNGIDDVRARAHAVGVGAFVTIGVGRSLDAVVSAVEVAEAHEDVWCTVGVHPHDAEAYTDDYAAELRKLATRPKVVAIGEAGLDYHYKHSGVEEQHVVFRKMIRLALELHKPLVIHTREARADTLRILREEHAERVGGIFHCFSEDVDTAEAAGDLDFHVSFSGILTFKNAGSVAEAAAWVPEDRILVETDSPYLAPVPHRGKPCEPAYVVHTARKLAEIRSVAPEQIAESTTRNAIRRFALPL